jgi:hypothetical protein
VKILFDQGTPVPLRRSLATHSIDTAFELGWSNLRNGELLGRAEERGYDLLVTTDQQIRHQQNLSERRLAILVLLSTSWPRIRSHLVEIEEAVNRIRPGDYREISISTQESA